ncbi:site-specific integrase [Salinibacterium sp. ZJ450]|uniref:tyrosine-type recombinase/integrase n=1 Tax=Salinibacterium sp. ZJ450 TaxID=2708338 RepID=UPI00142089A0|nr:site-specific integrase [Salinibacterium sp. ZJ450]
MAEVDEAVKKARRTAGAGTQFFDEKRNLWVMEYKPDRIRVTARTQSRVEQKFRDARSNAGLAKIRVVSNPWTVKRWMWHWFDTINRSKPRTRAGYKSKISTIIIPAIGHVLLTDFTAEHAQAIVHYAIRTGRSATSARQAQAIFASAALSAETHKLMPFNPMPLIKKIPARAYKPVALSVDDAFRVFDVTRNDRLGSRWAAGLLTAARQGEILGLEIERADFGSGLIHLEWALQAVPWAHGCSPDPIHGGMYPCGKVRGGSCPERRRDVKEEYEHRVLDVDSGLMLLRPKTRGSARTVPMEATLRAWLEERVDEAATEPNPFGLMWTSERKRNRGGNNGRSADSLTPSVRTLLPLDGSPIDPSADNRAWHAVLERAGGPQVRVHDSRVTAVTLMRRAGIPLEIIRSIAGHATVEMSLKYDAGDATFAAERDALSRLGASINFELRPKESDPVN